MEYRLLDEHGRVTAVPAKSGIASTCSECGVMLANWVSFYCPGCGARVEGSE